MGSIESRHIENIPQLMIKIHKITGLTVPKKRTPLELETNIYYGDNPVELLYHTTSESTHVENSLIIFNEELLCDISFAVGKTLMFIDFELVDSKNVSLGHARSKNLFQYSQLEETKICLPLSRSVVLEFSVLLKQDETRLL
jgi:hypothetical protein